MLRRILRRILGRDRATPTAAPAPTPHPYRPPTPAPSVSPPAASADETHDRIRDIVHSQRIVLFMKGVPTAPQCGFSARAAAVLDGLGADYQAIDVLADDGIRQGIKRYASWPTIPQLYVDGSFVGGCDILVEMSESGELAELIGTPPPHQAEAEPVSIHQTSASTVAAWLQAKEDFRFIDVRTPMEHQIAHIDGAELLTQEALPELEALPRDTRIAFLCHHGVRSQNAAMAFQSMGFTNLHNIVGGIDAWSIEVDPDVPRY